MIELSSQSLIDFYHHKRIIISHLHFHSTWSKWSFFHCFFHKKKQFEKVTEPSEPYGIITKPKITAPELTAASQLEFNRQKKREKKRQMKSMSSSQQQQRRQRTWQTMRWSEIMKASLTKKNSRHDSLGHKSGKQYQHLVTIPDDNPPIRRFGDSATRKLLMIRCKAR